MITQKAKKVLSPHKYNERFIPFDMKCNTFRWLPFLAAALLIGSVCIFNFRHADTVSSETTSVRFRITDLGGNALARAEVVLPEQDLVFYTDNNGYTPKILIPVSLNGLSEKLDTDWFPVTVYARCEGYVPTILFHCILYRSRFRDGPTIRLFTPQETSAPYVAIVETPPDDWTEEFLNGNSEFSKVKDTVSIPR